MILSLKGKRNHMHECVHANKMCVGVKCELQRLSASSPLIEASLFFQIRNNSHLPWLTLSMKSKSLSRRSGKLQTRSLRQFKMLVLPHGEYETEVSKYSAMLACPWNNMQLQIRWQSAALITNYTFAHVGLLCANIFFQKQCKCTVAL